MNNYKAVLKYDGTNYYGYAIQNNYDTIQARIENALYKIFDEKIRIFASGRTDKKVHALEQVISFKSKKYIEKERLTVALNNYLPSDIQIIKVKFEKEDFNARFSVKSKIYQYIINNDNFDLFKRNQETFISKKIDFNLLSKVAIKFEGTHDFLSFTTSNKKNSIRNVHSIKVKTRNKKIFIEIEANGFLRYMVRMIVAKMISVSIGEQDNVSELLTNPKKGSSIFKAPPHGLYLKKVKY